MIIKLTKETQHTNQLEDRQDKEQYNRACTNTSKFSVATVLNPAFNIHRVPKK